jgi:hypothetical protein
LYGILADQDAPLPRSQAVEDYRCGAIRVEGRSVSKGGVGLVHPGPPVEPQAVIQHSGTNVARHDHGDLHMGSVGAEV